jgi:histidine kinase
MFHKFRSRLSVKLFLSYLLVIFIGGTVLAVSIMLAIPRTFERHMLSDSSEMQGMMQEHMGRRGGVGFNNLSNFQSAVIEAVVQAAVAALITAVMASLWMSRKVVAPVRRIMQASQRIAAGHYQERVPVDDKYQTTDRDELGLMALSFNQMADELEQTEARRRQLIGDVSHELRTPLTTIKGYLEGLEDGMLPPEPETYQAMVREAGRMQRLVADLQELSRVEAGAYELDKKWLSIQSVIESTLHRLNKQYDEKQIALQIDVADDLPQIQADEIRLEQVLINLASNALQYTPAGGKIVISARQDHDWLVISVQDNGVGIPEKDLPFIFDRFYRVDKSRSRAGGGSGIGLTIARHLVEAHGGRIQAFSEGIGKGSKFEFTLPIQ